MTLPARLAEALSDRYRLESELGQGGMATVYLAHDLRHDRRVAVKVLRPELAAVIGAERFLAEIKTTANLQHPHILSLFDSGEAAGTVFYVMPFVEGESLRDRLAREHQLPVDEAVRIAREVADALHYAHGHGVIHRDIKPENILLHGGHALVADFGIALAVSRSDGGSRMTETGMSLGTPHYMSPEQAMGEREITARSDVYALGCVLYEMLTGEPPFTGATAQAIVARVVTEQPRSLTTQRRTVPPEVEAAVFTALEKLPADRYATAAEFSAALSGGGPATRRLGAATARPPAASGARRYLVPVLGSLLALTAVLAAWGWFRPEPPRPVRRYSMGIPPNAAMQRLAAGSNIALSPDGSLMVYVGPGDGGGQLWLRERDQLDATPLPGTNGAINLFFSPDGKHVGFSAGTLFDLKVVPVSGGPAVTLFQAGTGAGGGAAWGPDGWIYFDTQTGLHRMPEGGGTPEPFLPLDTASREVGHAWPEVLPGGKAVLFRSRRNLDAEDFDLVAVEVASRKRHVLAKGLMARFVAPDILVYLRSDGTLVAAPFDTDKLELTGPAVPLVEGVATKNFGAADIAVSREGTLAYTPGRASTGEGTAEAVWVARDGSVRTLDPSLKFANAANRGLSLSPNGSLLAVDVLGARSVDIWVKQLPSGPFSRLSFEGTNNNRPTWTGDGRSVIYISNRDSSLGSVWRQQADGARPAERVLRSPPGGVQEVQLSRDGQWLVYRTTDQANRNVYAVRLGRDTTPVPILTSRFSEDGVTLSPDGRWLAYVSDESGQAEVYVRPFPDVASGRWQVSTAGGDSPRWGRSGRELFFQDLADNMMVVPVRGSPTFLPSQPQRLFTAISQLIPSNVVPYWDISPDDKRFLMVRITGADQAPGAGQVVMVDNWFDEVRRKVRAGR
jgi:serine/threonine-protein kinase